MKRNSFVFLKTIVSFIFGISLLATIPSPALATLWEIDKGAELYGWLDQDDIPSNSQGNIGSMACGPTAAVNSFVYLEKKYSYLYGSLLIPDTVNNDIYDYSELIAVANTLIGSDYMKTTIQNGTEHDDFIMGKQKYINQQAPNTTTYLAQDFWAKDYWSADVWGIRPWWVDPIIPTWGFIYQELLHCEDVEILLNGGYNHYLTLYGLSWNDQTNKGLIQFIDPGTGAKGSADVWLDMSFVYENSTSWLRTSYGGRESQITVVVSESPVPEPSSLMLMALGVLLMVQRLRFPCKK